MKGNISILRGGNPVGVTVFDFPGGEVGVKVDTGTTKSLCVASFQTIVARIQSSRDLMVLVMLTDALRRIDETPIHLVMPYVPYARQDRVCVHGEPFSLKVFANIINALDYKTVTVFDPHSDVVGAVIDRLTVISQKEIIHKWDKFCNRLIGRDIVLVSPDAGSNKKVAALAAYLGHNEFVRADKLRHLDTGKIKETIVYAENLNGLTCVIADDICDGGASFIPLARALKNKGAAKVLLYTTHAIYSKGIEVLTEGGIDELWATNSYKMIDNPAVNVFDIQEFIK